MLKRKKIFVSILVLLLVAITGGTVLAAMPNSTYSNFSWKNTFRQNRIGSYYANETRLIQRAISSIMTPGFAVDGIFGPNTDEKVRTYQGLQGLTKDGIVGSDTWNNMQHYPQWSRDDRRWSSGRGMYYYGYKTIHDSSYYIRHYSDGAWYVLASDGVWYRVN